MGAGSDLSRLNATQNLGLGMLSGVCSKLCNYPLLSWKNASQQSLPISLTPAVVYRGLPMACLNLGGTTAVQFWTTGFFQNVVSSDVRHMTSSEQMLGSFLGGVASGVPCSLWELIMIQQQRYGGSVVSAPARIVSEFGAATLLRGVVPTMGRESLYTMAMLGVTPLMQQAMVEEFGMDPNVGLAVGALAGSFFSATLTHPMDTVKTCMQGDCEQNKYTNIRGTGQSLVDEFGVRAGLFKGLAWRISLITTTFFLVNKFKQELAPRIFSNVSEDE
jgi:solute carrier family 25 carnitine/acylcarnitine transporter 20/29